jgi:TonB family protein
VTNAALVSLASLSVKVALLGGLAWVQLALLRRAPASSRSRLCSLALIAILLLAVGEIVSPAWVVKAPLYTFVAAAARGAAHVTRRSSGMSARSWLAIVWAAGAAFLVARAAAGRIALAILRRRTQLLQRISDVDVRIGQVETPVLAGVVRPAILLPESAREWPEQRLQMALTHELTHFSRGDCWTNLLGQTLRCVFWFHPMVWLLVARMSREQELTCDEAVVAAGHSSVDYAAFLLDSARNLKSRQMFSCAMAGSGARSLKERFRRLLDPVPRPVLTRRIIVSLAAFSAVAIAIAVTAIRPVWSQNVETHDGRVYKVGGDVAPPRVLHKSEPEYTEEARREKLSGTCLLRIVVTPDGRADDIEVIKSVNPGLDLKAMQAVAQWEFEPGTKDGVPVAVYATVEVNFRLL